PGHGVTTGGKRSPDESLREYEFNRDVAYRLKALLEEHPAIGVKLLQCFLASLSEKIMRSNELRREAAAYDHNAINGILEE
ncbi:MAG: hypothetical protein UD575_05790, partial [Oscillospiraceae bacterium]|nr:hypothetical protein [Oscillospiraceae bacterium]